VSALACVSIGTAIGLGLFGLYVLNIWRGYRRQERAWRERQERE